MSLSLFRSLFSAKTTTFQCQLSSVGVDINQDSLYKRNGSTDDLIVKYPGPTHDSTWWKIHQSSMRSCLSLTNCNSSIYLFSIRFFCWLLLLLLLLLLPLFYYYLWATRNNSRINWCFCLKKTHKTKMKLASLSISNFENNSNKQQQQRKTTRTILEARNRTHSFIFSRAQYQYGLDELLTLIVYSIQLDFEYIVCRLI